MTSGGDGTIWVVYLPATAADASAHVVADSRGTGAVVTKGLLGVVLVVTVVVGFATAAIAQNGADPPIPPDPTTPVTTPTTEPPDTTTSLPPETTTTFVPPPAAPTTPPTFAPTTPTTIAPTSSTTEPTDSSVVADDRTVVEPAPDVVVPAGDGGTDVSADGGNGWWTAGTRLRLAVAGLSGLAMVVTVLTLLYWRHTKPDLTLSGPDSRETPE